MSGDLAARAFEPFFTTKPTGSGSGLGLSQVYDFVRQVGGHVALASEPGRGTEVRLFLPQAKAAPMPTLQARPQPAARPNEVAHGQIVTVSSASVLVVEDDPDVSDLVQQTLREAGCRVIAAKDGHEAMHVLEQSGHAIDLVFTDLIMPNGMTGLEVARQARRLFPGIAVVLTSGQDPETPEDVRAALEFPILRKPYHLAELRALIAQTLQRVPEPRRA
jgi:CheY-like chemotaxis protein